MKRFTDRLPNGPLTEVSFVFGWALMLIGTFIILRTHVEFPVNIYYATTAEFLQDTDPHAFGLFHLIAGFFVAKPGWKHRRVKNTMASLVAVSWVGVNMWPLFTGSGNPISFIGIIMWASVATILLLDSFSPTYNKHYNSTHYHH